MNNFNIEDLFQNYFQIDDLFETFIENINSIPISDHNFIEDDENFIEDDANFILNQSIINNAYLLRRSFELNNIPNTSIQRNLPLNLLNQTINRTINQTINSIEEENIEQSYDNMFSSLFDNFNEFIDEQIRVQEELEDVKITLSDKDFDKLNSTVLDKSILKNHQCSICLEDTMLSDKLIILQCKHIYHKDCLKQWVTNNSTKCCVCRFDIRDELE